MFLDVEAADKEALLRHLSRAQAARLGRDPGEVERAILEREKVMSTGIGEGVAIPHAKLAGLKSISLAFARTARPLEFAALDGRPVRLVFQMLGPAAGVGEHVKMMARLARALKDPVVRRELEGARTVEEVLEALKGR